MSRAAARIRIPGPIARRERQNASTTAVVPARGPRLRRGIRAPRAAARATRCGLHLDHCSGSDGGGCGCTTIKLAAPGSFKREYGKPFVGSTNGFGDSDANGRSGWIFAVDADSGKVLWRHHTSMPAVASLTPTAGGIVFTGDLEGNLLAFDSASGRLLLKTPASGPVGGGIITYLVGGRQYVAVASGMKNAIMETQSGPASVVIYALPSAAARRASTRRAASNH